MAVDFTKCPGEKTQAADFGTNRKRIYWDGEVAVSDGYVHSSTHQSGQYFEFGGHTVRIVAKSHDGNHQANCNFGVTITDEEIPNITFCPDDVYITLGYVETSKSSLSIPDSTVIDYIDDTPVKVVLYESDEFFAGVTRVSHIYTDFSCNRAICEFSVILESPECTGSTFEDNCYKMECSTSNYNNYVSNCQSMNAEPVSIHSNAENEFLKEMCIDSGRNNVYMGLEAVGSTSGTLTDEQLDWNDGTPVDFIDVDAPDLDSRSSEYCHAFDRSRSYHWEEVSCNAGYCGICKHVVSSGPSPDFAAALEQSCPSNIVMETESGVDYATATWTPPVVTLEDQNVPITSSHQPGDQFILGTTLVEISATHSGATGYCKFTVYVEDTESPVFSGCPDDISLPADAFLPTTNVVWSDPTASDNSGASPLVVNQSFYSNDVFRLGIHEVTYIATDLSGNEAQCNFSITIFDSEDPIFFNGSHNLVLNTNPGLPTSPVWWSVTDIARDNSEEIPIINCTYVPGHIFRFGNYTVNCVATDDAGNYAIHTFYIAILDEEIPLFTSQPNSTIVETDSRQPHALMEWIIPTVFDNSMEEVFVNSTHQPNTTFPIGDTTVTYWAYDIFKNVNQFSFNITVLDTEVPVFFNLTANITVFTEVSVNFAHVNWVVVDVWDNSGEPLNVTSTYSPGDLFYVGLTDVTYTAIDQSGNIEWFTFSILVLDRESPVFIYCPTDIVIPTWYRSPYVNVTWQLPNVTDNVGVHEIVSNYNPNDVFRLGGTTVIYNATDRAMNFQDCQFNITVIDVEKPYFTNCTLDFDVDNIPGTAYANVTWFITTWHDNSEVPPHVTSDANPGDIFPLYDTLVTYTAVDGAGNVELCQFTITVNDVDVPYFTNFTEDIQMFIDSIYSNVTVEWAPPYPDDNSGALPLLESTHDPGDVFSVGVTEVIYTATDESGNIQTHTFTVTIRIAFSDLRVMLYNKTDDVDILEISAIATERKKYRPLSEDEIDNLQMTLLTISETTTLIGNREVGIMTEETVNVTTTVLAHKKNMVEQIDIVHASEKILTVIATRETNSTWKRSSESVASNIAFTKNRVWSFHIQPKENVLDTETDNAKKIGKNDIGFLRIDPSSAGNVPETAYMVVSYYDQTVFEESDGNEKSSVTFDENEAEYIVPVPYELATGLITCTVALNTSKYSVAVDYSMELYTKINEYELYNKEHAVCSFWDEDRSKWSTSGCRRTDVIEIMSPVECHCDHTTTFGIFVPTEKYSDFDFKRLGERMGIYLLCLISIIASIYVLKFIHFTWGIFKGPVSILIYCNLLIAGLLLTVTFIISSETMDYSILCTTFGVLIHFFYMSILTWLIVECIYFYMLKTKARIKGLTVSKRPGYLLCGWGGAACTSGLFFGIHYGYNEISGCWLKFETGSLVAFIFPVMTLILIRMILIIIIFRTKFNEMKRKEYIAAQIRRCLKCSCFLFPFLICTWMFSLMVDNEYVFWLLFSLLFASNGIIVAIYCYCSYEMHQVRRINPSLSSQTLARDTKIESELSLDTTIDDVSCIDLHGESTTELDTVENQSETESEESNDEERVSSEELSDKKNSIPFDSEKDYLNKSDKESDDYDSDDACFGK
ncbi:uncharacterized protein [Antedon mediterranea]|uniref:uncharacterized protein n=1 Tax=Antedon mediterranea TaxID=105859 RepID=UPI003AF50789